MTANIARVCFSEVRLSQAQEHAGRYGDLGIGVHRSFVVEREGNPVFYVQSGKTGHIVESFAHALGKAKELVGNDENKRKGLLIPLEIICGYLKNMSEPDKTELKYYDEMEWRVVHVDRLMGKYIVSDEKADGVFRLVLSARDVRIIVFPDNATRMLALRDQFLQDYFGCDWPIVTTLDECEEF